jgi:hypothetical protein
MPSFDLPDVFLSDFGATVVSGGTTGKGILDMPTEIVAGGMVLTTDYALTFKTATFPALGYGSALTVDGVAYTVREVRLQDDGVFSIAYLQKT